MEETHLDLNDLQPDDLFLVNFRGEDSGISDYYLKYKGYWMRVIANKGWSSEGDVVHYSAACFLEDNRDMPTPTTFLWETGKNLNWRPIWDFIKVKRGKNNVPLTLLLKQKDLPNI